MNGSDFSDMKNCRLCPRACGADRTAGQKGFCRASDVPAVAKVMLHRWEEPCICPEPGSGAVFFSGCGLRCVFCQNYEISQTLCGKIFSGQGPLPALGHTDADGDKLCDRCGEYVGNGPSWLTPLLAFFARVLRFLRNLFHA